VLLLWGAAEPSRQGLSEVDLVQARSAKDGGRGRVERKIINPPNMGTKSDPKTKLTIPSCTCCSPLC
jgi:hypothetical protein